jgi:hypothetical protein
MSASHRYALPAIAAQLVLALKQYDGDVGRMVESWPDLNHYHGVSAQIEQIRMYSSALDELVHLLWRSQHGKDPAALGQIQMVREHHSDSVAALRGRCKRVIARGAAPLS